MDAGGMPDYFHQLLTKTFRGLGATDPTSMIGTLLLKDGYFVGQKFRCEGFQAVLLAGGDEIELYDEGGTLLKTIRVEARDQERAA
jgi:hypothetical protein